MSLIHSEPQNIIVNSANRNDLTQSHSNFTYVINLNNKKYDRVVLLGASIPKSYYLIGANYNTFTLIENSIEYTIQLTAGNYSRLTLQTEITTQLNSSGCAGTYSMSFNVSTGKFSYSVVGQTGQPSFVFEEGLYEQLGFDRNSTNNFLSDSLISDNVIKLQSENTIFIHSSLVGNDGILQEIFCNTPDFSYIEWTNITPEFTSKKLRYADDNTFRFSLTDENGHILDTNGLNIVLSLCFYVRNDTSEYHKKDILINNLEKLSN